MDVYGMIGEVKKVEGNGRTPRNPTHTVFVHHKAQMARAPNFHTMIISL